MRPTTILTSLSATLAMILPSASSAAKTTPKNILFIAIDDLKPLLGCYGDTTAVTPNIDALADRSTLFTRAYCQQAVSAATRASLLTGQTPDRTQVWDLMTKIRDKNPDILTLPQYFKESGYTTTGVGKVFDHRTVDGKKDEVSWSKYIKFAPAIDTQYGETTLKHYLDPNTKRLVDSARAEGIAKGITAEAKLFSYIQSKIRPATECVDVTDEAYGDGAIAKVAVDFLNNYNSQTPFFFAVGFSKPHLPFVAPKRYWDMYDRESIPLAEFRTKSEGTPELAFHTSSETRGYTDVRDASKISKADNLTMPESKQRELIHGYYACVSYIDAMVGKVVKALDESGARDNTIIVLWGDHGWHLGDHGMWNKHSNFENATHVPMLILDPSSQSNVVDAPVEYLDFFPTLCSLAGIEIPAGLDGDDLAEVVRSGDESKMGGSPYAVSQYHRTNAMGYSLRDSRYRYTIWVDWTDRNLDPSKVVGEELYDYEVDPNESRNYLSDPQYREALAQMRRYFAEYMTKRGTR